ATDPGAAAEPDSTAVSGDATEPSETAGSGAGAVAVSWVRRSRDGPAAREIAAPARATEARPASSDRCRRPAAAVARAPAMPPTLHTPWNEASRLRPYRRCTATPCMFMVASTSPRNSPTAASTAYRPGRVPTAPAA